MHPLLTSVLRGIRQIRTQAKDIWQATHRPSRHPPEARAHGSPNRGLLQLVRERHLSMPDDERD